MKRTLAILLSVVLTFSLTSCVYLNKTYTSTQLDESRLPSVSKATDVYIAGMKGPTSIGLVGLMEQNSKRQTKNHYVFSIAGSADEIAPLLIKGELDMAAIPANLASVLYNKTNGGIQLLALNTLGVLYVVSAGIEVQSLEDLRGQIIYAAGKGTTPEYTFRHILSANGIDPDTDLTLEFKSEASEAVAALAKDGKGIAMLPQPYVTVAQGKIDGLQTVIDLNAEWEKLNDSGIVTGVLAVRKAFADENPDAVKQFLAEYEASVALVSDDLDTTSQLVEKYGIFAADVAKKAIPQCNITFISGEEMITPVKNYLGVLYEYDAQSVGQKLPDEDFFYVAK